MNYIQIIARKIKSEVPEDLLPKTKNDDSLFASYAVILLAKGQQVTEEDVHNAWAAWMSEVNPNHESIKPFHELSSSVQKEDKPFVDAIKRAAKAFEANKNIGFWN